MGQSLRWVASNSSSCDDGRGLSGSHSSLCQPFPCLLTHFPLPILSMAQANITTPTLEINSQVQTGNMQKVAALHPRCLSTLPCCQCVRCLTVPAPTVSYRAGLRAFHSPVPSVPTTPCGIFGYLHFTEEAALELQGPTPRTVSQCLY